MAEDRVLNYAKPPLVERTRRGWPVSIWVVGSQIPYFVVMAGGFDRGRSPQPSTADDTAEILLICFLPLMLGLVLALRERWHIRRDWEVSRLSKILTHVALLVSLVTLVAVAAGWYFTWEF